MALKFYYDLISQPCRAMYMFLRLNKIPYEDKLVALRKGEHLTDDYKKTHPFQLVPAMEEDGFRLTESLAMVDYIMKTRDVSEYWYPTSDVKKRARINEYLHWQHANTRLHCTVVFQNLLIIPRATGKPVNQEVVKRGRENVQKVVHNMENYFLHRTPYVHSQVLTVADLFGVCEFMQLHGVLEEGLYEGSPKVKAWMDLVNKQTSPVFEEAHRVMYMVRDTYKKMSLE